MLNLGLRARVCKRRLGWRDTRRAGG